jgi:hypothetical protein
MFEILSTFQWVFCNWECGGSNPPASARQSSVLPGFPRDAGMRRKSRLFAHWLRSPDSRFAEEETEIPESLRPFPRIFPFCGDYRRRRVRSGLPPEDGSVDIENLIRSINGRPIAEQRPAKAVVGSSQPILVTGFFLFHSCTRLSH